MTSAETPSTDAPPSRDELVTLVSRAHHDGAYAESSATGRALAAQSRLPTLVAVNLGAGFGQWDFFPEAATVVDFALAYAPPSTAEDVWAMARTWASDDAAGRHTLMALVGREILQHELRRIDVPKLAELFSESRASRALTLRASLGLEVPAQAAARPESPRKAAAKRAAAPAGSGEIPMRMPKPEMKRPAKAPPPPPPKRFQHPKFGEGTLQVQDGAGPDAKLTIKFAAGPKTLLARYVTELPTGT
jgi:hypothetical protein